MSDRIKKAAGMILLLTGILLTLIPLFGSQNNAKTFHVSGNRIWVPETIKTEQNGAVRINDADAETLESLPGIGPAYAARILEEKRTNGPFYYPEDLEAVSGIGPQTLTKFRTMIDMTMDEGGKQDGIPGVIP